MYASPVTKTSSDLRPGKQEKGKMTTERENDMLYIKDKDFNEVRPYGSDKHDSLVVNRDGALQYYNLQNGCGTGSLPNCTFSFVDKNGFDPREDETAKYTGIAFLDIGGQSYMFWKSVRQRIEELDELIASPSTSVDIGLVPYRRAERDVLKNLLSAWDSNEIPFK